MRVLVIGGGGREHALVHRLADSRAVKSIACAPGNPGIAARATCVPIAADDVPRLVEHAAAERYDLVVVGPEGPLCAGIADLLAGRGIRVFGPTRAAAAIEGSKQFAKDLMTRAGAPTARFRLVTRPGEAGDFSRAIADGGRVVVKADWLAAGKGVIIADDHAQARAAAAELLAATPAGIVPRLVVEEFLVGREASCMAFVDGERIWPLPPCEDHKTVFDGDQGPMTGGMGAISPTPIVDDTMAAQVARDILSPVARALADMGRPFRGLLYAGVMITADGPRVLEFNCRFGDPEAQPLLMRFRGDLGEALLAVAEGRRPEVEFNPEAACCVVLAARGYPGAFERGAEISGLDAAAAMPRVFVFQGGTRRQGDRLFTDGGRVLGVTALGADPAAARRRAYDAAALISFPGMQLRHDIGARSASTKEAR